MSVAQYPPNDGEGNKTLANGPEKARAGAKNVTRNSPRLEKLFKFLAYTATVSFHPIVPLIKLYFGIRQTGNKRTSIETT
ncbi:hypothetical protein QE152_g9606 [Popillia japonica]|uniref:Uncharacterized protein n=1 Tax=Popillia japonica TaxID=7064 RepID=A0AAW1LUD5_POPJA